MLGIIRVLTTDNEEVLQEHGKKIEEKSFAKTVTHCIGSQPNGIFDDASEREAIPKIVELAKEMSRKYKLDAITISCAADPALEETRAQVDLPILGAGVSGAHAAAMVGSKVGIVGITDEPPSRMKEELGQRFFKHRFSSELRKTTDLFNDGAKEELLRVVESLIDEGADVILFACTGFSTIRLKDYLTLHIKIPVIDLVEAQAIAYQLIGKEDSK
ncbi:MULTISPECIES: aspartate/glutamate racemase family protein [Planococcus]|uniref:aspartate/glutamate racemase family protein n=1 Tax=Planococcus TaxID=1372 RepID=UPI001FEE2688|nr:MULTISPECIES: aspartate/glutamate racemase family protein [Planococcus]MCJ1908300.1 aspartate/glutamate racemase family protein [Planococcus ruber]GKW45303.1 hydantoin racemase [Planococcus sp. NCCP-2050]